jgi:HEAT repeat protein
MIMSRPREASVELTKRFLRDADERLQRMAARELIRRRPADFEQALLPLMGDAPESVRKLVGRSIGQSGFERFWENFDAMPRATRGNAGKALLKILPDAAQRLGRRLANGSNEQRIKALQMTQELGLIVELKALLLPLCANPNAKVRSKAVGMLGAIGIPAVDLLIEKAVSDIDPRVRANAIEVMEGRGNTKFVPLLAERAKTGQPRERANAIKALHSMRISAASGQLLTMLRDDRPEHRISAMWALRRMGVWKLLAEVASIAKADGNLKVRRYAMAILQGVMSESKGKSAA